MVNNTSEGVSQKATLGSQPNDKSLSTVEWEGLAKKATATRDLVLVGAGVLYFVGFLVWSIYGFANNLGFLQLSYGCLLYTSDAADDLLCVDLGGRRIIK